MHHETHVGFVDTHTESVGGHHDLLPVEKEILLVVFPLLIGQPRVISGDGISPFHQLPGNLLHQLSGETVNDSTFLVMLSQVIQQRFQFVGGMLHQEFQIFPVKTGGHLYRVP